jgi:hypothetical protein
MKESDKFNRVSGIERKPIALLPEFLAKASRANSDPNFQPAAKPIVRFSHTTPDLK